MMKKKKKRATNLFGKTNRDFESDETSPFEITKTFDFETTTTATTSFGKARHKLGFYTYYNMGFGFWN